MVEEAAVVEPDPRAQISQGDPVEALLGEERQGFPDDAIP
jgi:hypothetical protein